MLNQLWLSSSTHTQLCAKNSEVKVKLGLPIMATTPVKDKSSTKLRSAKGIATMQACTAITDQMYAIPVLMSGLGSLVLSEQEINLIDMHHKETLRCLLRLQQNTPRSVTYFMAGCLPGSALLHLRQLSLFGMITRLQGSLLYQHASNISSYNTISNKSWFHQIRKWCLLYGLPHPQELLSSPLSKAGFKTLVKKKVICYWETLLRAEAQPKLSLEYFKPSFMSLTSSHPMFTTAGSSPAKVSMALVQSSLQFSYMEKKSWIISTRSLAPGFMFFTEKD